MIKREFEKAVQQLGYKVLSLKTNVTVRGGERYKQLELRVEDKVGVLTFKASSYRLLYGSLKRHKRIRQGV